jgi:membrane-associated phospholipid phosphatase
VSKLQEILLDQRIDFLRDPAVHTAQGIAAFASLHVSIIFTGVLVAHMLGLGRRLRVGAWVLLALTTTSTIYLGWHYVVDDLGGLVLAAMAVALAKALSGFDVRTARRLSTAKAAAA